MNSINLTRIDDSEAVSEYYKQLRTNIYFCGQDKQCIALTSCFPNEGKSTVAFNLCKALAEDIVKGVDCAKPEDCIYLMREQWEQHSRKKEEEES